ncbi:recombinase family protein [uncultured Nocardioides sp.]|uniref:recombinase family protein n=1 Tax=uncultured Nocardioides sp. TaxID=198441 RepID=UPI0026044B1A|nr:recombinase family protein [uncultured Nocardioides sp.]
MASDGKPVTLNVGLYLRVSTAGQVESESLPAQERDCRVWAEAQGHKVAGVFSDPGRSGTLPAGDRPGLTAALDALTTGTIDGLVMRDLDRLARQLTIQEVVLAQVWARPNTAVFTLGGEVPRDDPDDPMRTFARQVMGAAAELERSMLVKRMRDGRRYKAEQGQHANGPAPYGWRSVNGDLRSVQDEQVALGVMRRLAAQGWSHARIAAALREGGHPTKRGGAWSPPVVSRILARDTARTPAQRAYQEERLSLGL